MIITVFCAEKRKQSDLLCRTQEYFCVLLIGYLNNWTIWPTMLSRALPLSKDWQAET